MSYIDTCCTNNPSIEELKEIEDDFNNNLNSLSKSFTSDQTIPIEIVYHICHNTLEDSDEDINNDCIKATELLNKAYNLDLKSEPQVKPEGFDSGRDIYSIENNPLKDELSEIELKEKINNEQHPINILRNAGNKERSILMKDIEHLNKRIHRRHQYVKRRLGSTLNRKRRRRITKGFRFIQKRIKKKLYNKENEKSKLERILAGYYKNIIKISKELRNTNDTNRRYNKLRRDNENRYNNYVNRAGKLNVNFIYEKKVINRLPTITTNRDEGEEMNRIIKIDGSPIEDNDKLKLKLHIWVVNFNNGILGYGQFPWVYEKNPSTDGVVIAAVGFQRSHPNYESFNRGNNGYIIAHEVGHWLGLLHTFQQSSDAVSDTPIQKYPTRGNPYDNNPNWPSSTHKYHRNRTIRSYHQFMNYMDYTNDECTFMFTKGQCIKMKNMINKYRS